MEEAYSDTFIEKYLSGELSDAEKDAFEKQLDMDESLRKELEVAVKARAAIYAKGIEERKEAFAERWQEQKQQEILQDKFHSRRRLIPYVAVAAAIVGLLLLFNFFRPDKVQLSNQELFAQYYEAPLAPSIRVEGAVSNFKKANAAFHQGKFEEAALLYTQALRDASFVQKDEARFFGGISYLELGQGTKALELFEQLEGANYQEMKNWYSVMAYLQLDQAENARAILTQITQNPQHFYREKAEELLQKL